MDKYLAKELNQIAKVNFATHDEACRGKDPFNCWACNLQYGYDNGPVRPGWAKTYVEAEQPIPEEWRNAFYDELTDPNNGYRKQLEESVRYFGVRWF